MVNQPQGHNSMDSSAALLQQQHNFDVQVSGLLHFHTFHAQQPIEMLIKQKRVIAHKIYYYLKHSVLLLWLVENHVRLLQTNSYMHIVVCR